MGVIANDTHPRHVLQRFLLECSCRRNSSVGYEMYGEDVRGAHFDGMFRYRDTSDMSVPYVGELFLHG